MDKLNSIIVELEKKVQDHLEKSLLGEDGCPVRTYEVGLTEAYNDVLHSLYGLRANLTA